MPVIATFGTASSKPYNYSGLNADPFYAFNASVLPTDGANAAANAVFLDSGTGNAGSPFTVTRTGTTGQGTFSPFNLTGYSLGIFSAAQYVTYPSTVLPVVSGLTFTIEGWVFLKSTPAAGFFANLLADSPAGAGTNYWNAGVNSSLQAVFTWYTGSVYRTATCPTVLSLNKWYYIQYISTAGTISISVNGENTTTTGDTVLSTPSSTIGTLITGTDRANTPIALYAGLRVSNVARAKTLPSAFYPTDANTRLLTLQGNRVADFSGNNFTTTSTGLPITFPFVPFVPRGDTYSAAVNGGSVRFTGAATSYLSVADSANLELGAGDWCIETWYYPTATGGSSSAIINKRANVASFGPFLLWRSNAIAQLYLSSNGTTWNILNGTAFGTLQQTAWNHIAVYKIGNNVYGALNGVVTTLYSGAAFTPVNNTSATFIGADSNGNPVLGYLSSSRIMVGSVPSGYTSTACPVPTAPFTNVTNTKLLLQYTNAAVVDYTQQSSIDTNTTSLTTTGFVWPISSLNFAGANHAVLGRGQHSGLDIRTGDFTVEFWIRVTNFTTNRFVYDNYQNNSGRMGITVDITTGTIRLVTNSAGLVISSVTPLVANTWTHVAFSRSAGTLRVFLDGIQRNSAANATVFPGNTLSDCIMGMDAGSPGTNYMLGQIDNFRVTNGVGRYIANFRVPNSPFLNR